VIGELRGLGLTIAEIRDLAAVCLGHPGESVGPHLAALLRRARDRADARIRTLQELRDRIDLALADDDLAGDAGRPRRVSQEIERPTRTGAKHRRLASGRVVSGPVRGPGNWPDFQGAPAGGRRSHPTPHWLWQPQPTQRPRRPNGAEGNERLTSMTGAVLLVLPAVEGLTILRASRLLTLHVFLGIPRLPRLLAAEARGAVLPAGIPVGF
jgi:hypothetical protein